MIILDSIIAVAPIISYFSQYSLIKQSRSVGSFSIDICAVLIISNTLRVFFWFANGYAFNLLIQSFLVIFMQFLILDLCLRFGYKSKQQFGSTGFWRWNKIQHFGIFTLFFAGVIGVLTLIFHLLGISSYGTILGLASLSIEATVAFPQMVRNQKNRSVQGLSLFMIFTWFLGDFLKTIYFVIKNQPFQFILCGAFQLAIDSLIVIQVMAFSNSGQIAYKNVKPQYQVQYSIQPSVKS